MIQAPEKGVEAACSAPTLDQMETKPNLHTDSIDVVVIGYREGAHHIAYCLDLNLAGQGASMDEALSNLKETVLFQLRSAHAEGRPFASLVQKPPLSIRLKAAKIGVSAMLQICHFGVKTGCRYLLARLRENDLEPLQFLPA